MGSVRNKEGVNGKKNLRLKAERRKKKWAIQRGVEWKDGMPLALGQIQAFNNLPNLKDLLDDLVLKGYLHADKITTNKETHHEETDYRSHTCHYGRCQCSLRHATGF